MSRQQTSSPVSRALLMAAGGLNVPRENVTARAPSLGGARKLNSGVRCNTDKTIGLLNKKGKITARSKRCGKHFLLSSFWKTLNIITFVLVY
jgi:hypothetical protein